MEAFMLHVRSVSQRILVDVSFLAPTVSAEDMCRILKNLGFQELSISPVALARSCVGQSKYRTGVRSDEAPLFVDCSSFTKWLYGQCGLWVPRRPIQQYLSGTFVPLGSVQCGDLIFMSGVNNYYVSEPQYGVGHVGICTGEGTVIHADGEERGIVEEPICAFAPPLAFRGVRRFVKDWSTVKTYGIPRKQEVETIDDIKWKVLSRL
jgi:NlpC/P60 family